MNGMTGYSSKEQTIDETSLTTEVKTVNHRFLDINIYMPSYLNLIELKVRNLVQEKIKRGKVDIYISLKVNHQEEIIPETKTVEQYINAFKTIIDQFQLKDDVRLFHLTRFDDIIKVKKNTDYSIYWDLIEKNLNANLDEIIQMRQIEGEATRKNLLQIINQVNENIEKIHVKIPDMEKAIFENIKKKLDELIGEKIDEPRLANEAAIIVSKSCINEEIERLRFHADHFIKLLATNNDVGKKLDFICQEMHREINTIGSKITLSILSENVISIKSDVEKLREQVRNVE